MNNKREKGAQARLTRRPRIHPRRTANRDQENRDNTHSLGDPKPLTYITLTHHNKRVSTHWHTRMGSHPPSAHTGILRDETIDGPAVIIRRRRMYGEIGRRRQTVTIARRAQARRLGRTLRWYTNNYKLIARLPGRHISSLDYCNAE